MQLIFEIESGEVPHGAPRRSPDCHVRPEQEPLVSGPSVQPVPDGAIEPKDRFPQGHIVVPDRACHRVDSEVPESASDCFNPVGGDAGISVDAADDGAAHPVEAIVAGRRDALEFVLGEQPYVDMTVFGLKAAHYRCGGVCGPVVDDDYLVGKCGLT